MDAFIIANRWWLSEMPVECNSNFCYNWILLSTRLFSLMQQKPCQIVAVIFCGCTLLVSYWQSWRGLYVLLRPSVRHVSCTLFLKQLDKMISYLVYGLVSISWRSSSSLVSLKWFLWKLWSLQIENFVKILVFSTLFFEMLQANDYMWYVDIYSWITDQV